MTAAAARHQGLKPPVVFGPLPNITEPFLRACDGSNTKAAQHNKMLCAHSDCQGEEQTKIQNRFEKQYNLTALKRVCVFSCNVEFLRLEKENPLSKLWTICVGKIIVYFIQQQKSCHKCSAKIAALDCKAASRNKKGKHLRYITIFLINKAPETSVLISQYYCSISAL